MEREVGTLSIRDLRATFVEIEFPEYQREPDIWSRDQKQRLVDSILRRFDIASIYLYRRTDSGLECIDGRQRLNAIMSFLGDNPMDERDDGFPVRFQNEISSSLPAPFEGMDGLTYQEIEALAEGGDNVAEDAVTTFLGYHLSVVYLSGASQPDEFNLQFLRLNLGTLINAGEKLHAMVGNMRDLLFDRDGVGGHSFFQQVGIPTRRYATELTAAQVLLQAFEQRTSGSFTRARHFDLQRFVKTQADVANDHPVVREVIRALDCLAEVVGEAGGALRNRAITVSVILVVWEQRLFESTDRMRSFADYLAAFLDRLKAQVTNMKNYEVDPRYGYLVDFQRHLTQASVERPAVARRHEILAAQFRVWEDTGKLEGDE